MDKIVAVVEQTGENIIGNQAVRAHPGPGGNAVAAAQGIPQKVAERQPMIRLSSE